MFVLSYLYNKVISPSNGTISSLSSGELEDQRVDAMPRPGHPGKADSRRDSSSRLSRMTEQHQRNQFSNSSSSTSAYGVLPPFHEVPVPPPLRHTRPAISFPPPDSPEWLPTPTSPQRKTHGKTSSGSYRPPSPVSPSPTTRRSVNVGTSASAPRPPVNSKDYPREDTRRSRITPLNEYLPTPPASFNAGSAAPSTPKRRQPVDPASFYQTPPPEPARRPAASHASASNVSPAVPRQASSLRPPSEPVKRTTRKSAAASSVAPGSVPVPAEWSAKHSSWQHKLPPDFELKAYQKCSRTWMARKEADPKFKGGVLADDMGFGKTITMLVRVYDDFAENGRTGPTLIVCPTSLLTHWKLETEKVDPEHEQAPLIYEYHGTRRNKNVSFLQSQDIVITTYGIVSSDFSPMGVNNKGVWRVNPDCAPQGLFAVDWRRIILDEGHLIHSKGIKRSIACGALKSEYRWAMTGTPIQNTCADLYSLFDFLRITHLAPRPVFPRGKRELTLSPSQVAEVHTFLEQMMLRRTKKDKYNWDVTLTPPVLHRMNCVFSEREHQFYRVVAGGTSFRAGKTHVPAAKNALAGYTRKRQACLHPQLVYQNITSEQEEEEFDEEEMKLDLSDPDEKELDEMHDEMSDAPPPLDKVDVSRCGTSTKMKKLLSILEEIKQRPGVEKTVLISQFTSFLDILGGFLKEHGYETVRYDGRMSRMQRDMALQDIGKSVQPMFTVMLLSLKAGGTGLNLATCNNVIIMDPWFNPAVEEQAVNRVHRIGQDKTVHVYKIIIPGTVEDKILEMQRKKQEMADQLLSASEVLAQKLLSELWGQTVLSG